jgi:cobalt/nickel transport system permease protein
MDRSGTIIHVSSTFAAGLLFLAIFLSGLSIVLLARKWNREPDRGAAPDWSIPTIDAYADTPSFFHNWDPAVKIGSLFPYCFLVVSLKSLFWCAVALIVSLLALLFSNIPWQRGLRRLTAMSGFLLMFLLIVPFTSPAKPGETLILLPMLHSLPFHLNGFYLALTIVLKAFAIALMMEPMLGTSSLPITLQGLVRLGVPSTIIQMILLTHRYIFVFQQEIIRMYRSMRVRGFTARTDFTTMKTMGNFFGMLFISSFDRTQKVYEAMLCRGYQGSFPTFSLPQTRREDLAKGGLWIMIGILLLVFDRTLPVLAP